MNRTIFLPIILCLLLPFCQSAQKEEPVYGFGKADNEKGVDAGIGEGYRAPVMQVL